MLSDIKTELDLWSLLMRGYALKIEDIARVAFNVDVSKYIETVEDDLPRFRRNRVKCDGTAALTMTTLYEMILPIINKEVYDMEQGEPNTNVIGVKYKCSPISYQQELVDLGKMNQKQIDNFGIKYTSEWIYE